MQTETLPPPEASLEIPPSNSPKNLRDGIASLMDRYEAGDLNPWTPRLNDGQRFREFKALAQDRGARYATATLDNFTVRCGQQREVSLRLRQMAAELPACFRSGGGLILYGPQGTGKDHLMFAMLRHAIVDWGCSAMWRDGVGLQDENRKAIKENDEPKLRERLAAPQILAISDPLPISGDLSEWNMNFLRDVIDRRYGDLKSTWITFNGTSTDDLKPVLSPQLTGRLVGDSISLACKWPSFRTPSREF